MMNTEPNNSDEFIRWLFRDRCIVCWKPAECIHEIVPRSSGEDSSDWKNRVTLCNRHHNMGDDSVHHKGTSDKAIKVLQNIRIRYLKMIGRDEYI